MQRENTGSKRLLQKIEAVNIISNFEMLQKIEDEPPLTAINARTFPLLSSALEGYVPGELVVITGETGCGKTLLCQSFTKDFCKGGQRPLWFTYEMPPRFFLKKFALDSQDLQFYMPDDLEAYSIDWVCGITKKAHDKYDTNAIFIDHLHYIYDISLSRSPSIDIGYIVRRLKRLAVDLNVVVFIIAHITKARIESADDMGLHKIRDSSLIAQEADTALFVHRKDDDSGLCATTESIVKVCKARRTGVRNRIIPIVKDGFYLREVDL